MTTSKNGITGIRKNLVSSDEKEDDEGPQWLIEGGTKTKEDPI
jgi:hypothetical protein